MNVKYSHTAILRAHCMHCMTVIDKLCCVVDVHTNLHHEPHMSAMNQSSMHKYTK